MFHPFALWLIYMGKNHMCHKESQNNNDPL